MEHSGPYLTDVSFSQQAQLYSFQPGIEVGLLCSEPNGSQLDHAGASREVPNGRKRRGCIPPLSPLEKRMKKTEADRRYRKNHKDEFNKLRAIASRFGGVEKMEQEINEIEAELNRLRGTEQDFHKLQQMVTEFHRLEQMKYKFGRIEEMLSKLHRFDQITSMFGGIDEMVTEINRLKNIELQHIKYEQIESRTNHQNAQPFSDFLQQQDYHGIQPVYFNNQVQGSMVDWVWPLCCTAFVS
ncbi:hypothetical protein CRYUN_Cryun03dG0147500 [Craigia yunnanensis]